jgi:hypothetical protein
MEGGVIRDNYASVRGGGVYVAGSGYIALSGGSITANGAAEYGGGIFADADVEFTLAGNPAISGNSIDDPENFYGADILLYSKIKIVDTLTYNYKMNIALANSTGVFTKDWLDKMGTVSPAKYFVAEDESWIVLFNADGEGQLALESDTWLIALIAIRNIPNLPSSL